MADWDVVATAPAQTQNPWAVRSVAPVPTTAMDVVKGVGDAALSGVDRLAAGIISPPIQLANRLVAAVRDKNNGEEASRAAEDYINQNFVHNATTPVGQKIGNAVQGALAPVGDTLNRYKEAVLQGAEKIGIPRTTLEPLMNETGEFLGTAGVVAPIMAGARASSEAAQLAASNAPSWAARGYRSAADSPVAAGAAGPSGMHALTLQNQQVANTSLGAEAGIPHGTVLNHDTIEAGRAAADQVKSRVAAALPTSPLSPDAAKMVSQVGGDDLVTRSPDAQAIIDAQKSRLLAQPLTGHQVVNNIRALRQEGYARLGSEDVEQQQVGAAQLDMSKALERHVEDTLQPNADVTMDQWRDARVTQAKSSALQAALKGNNVDMGAIARMQRADPGLLTGAFKDAADFANQHPKVAGLANNIEVAPSFANDLGRALRSSGEPQDVLGRLFGASGIPSVARRVLTGDPAAAVEAARQTPVAGLGGEFAPLAPRQPAPLNLSPPAGTAFSPNQPQLATGAPTQRDFFGTGANNFTASPPAAVPAAVSPPGQIGLGELLSHGVEQNPPAELSVGPMGSPPANGIPYRPPPESFGMQASRSGRVPEAAPPAPVKTADRLEPPARSAAPFQLSDADAQDDFTLHNIPRDLAVRWAQRNPDYVDVGGENGLENRYAEARSRLEAGQPLDAPSAHLTQTPKGLRLEFYDGRHRFAAARDLGYDTIPLALTPESQKLLETRVSKPLGEDFGDLPDVMSQGVPEDTVIPARGLAAPNRRAR